MQQGNWSTSTVRQAERFDYWKDIVCDTLLYVEAQTVTSDVPFSAELSFRRRLSGNFVHFKSQEHRIERSHRMLHVKPDERYLISYQVAGCSHVSQGDFAFSLQPGDVGIVSAARPMSLCFSGPVERVIAVVSRAALETTCPWLAPGIATHLHGGHTVTRVLSKLMVELSHKDNELEESEELALGVVLSELLGAGRISDFGTPRDRQMRARVLGFLKANFTDPDLTPASAAARIGISERSLHSTLARTGTTFRNWIIEERLEQAAAFLVSPIWSGSTISEIAFRMGFRDLSHFSRRFKDRFGLSPRSYRTKGAGRS